MSRVVRMKRSGRWSANPVLRLNVASGKYEPIWRPRFEAKAPLGVDWGLSLLFWLFVLLCCVIGTVPDWWPR